MRPGATGSVVVSGVSPTGPTVRLRFFPFQISFAFASALDKRFLVFGQVR